MEENYLDLVREDLYRKKPNKLKYKLGDNDDSPKNRLRQGIKIKKEIFKAKAKLQKKLKKKAKHELIGNTIVNMVECISPKESRSNVKNRVAMPFKSFIMPDILEKTRVVKSVNLNKPQNPETVSVISKPISPSLMENDQLTFYPSSKIAEFDLKEVNKNNKSKKKRQLSESDSPKVSLKRKKNKPSVKKGIRLVFGDNLDDSGLDRALNSSPSKGQKNKIESKIKSFAKNVQVLSHSSDNSKLGKIVNSSPGVSQKKKIISTKMKVKNKPMEWEENFETNVTLDTSLEGEPEPNLNDTWENFVSSITNEKNIEKIRNKKKKPGKKLKNKRLRINGHKTDGENVQNVNNIVEIDDISNLVAENYLKKSVITNNTEAKTDITSSKKSDYTNGKQSEKIKQLKLKKTSLRKKPEANGSNHSETLNNSDVEFKRDHGNILKGMVEDPAEVSDSCDNEAVGVKGFKFQRFCNLFPPIHNQQFLGQNNVLNIPKKYFKVSQNDLETDWQIEEVTRSKSKKPTSKSDIKNTFSISKKHATVDKNYLETNSQRKRLPVSKLRQKINSGSSNKEKQQGKTINIVEMQVPSLRSSDCVSSLETQEIVQEKVDPDLEKYDNKNNLVQICEQIDHHVENRTDPLTITKKGIKDCSKNVSQPVIVTLKNGNKVVALSLFEEIHFHGLCSLRVLNGELDILGAIINSKSGEQKIYSPRGTALLYLKNKCRLFVEKFVKLKSLVSKELLDEDDLELTFNQHYAIFLCSQFSEAYIDFIERYISQKIFPEKNIIGPRADFILNGIWNKIQFSEKWEEVLDNTQDDLKIVISGGKGVGKSTFLRYAINFLLRRFKKIRVIDLDPGQSEFFAPGCICVVTVDKEVFGPNYTHFLKPHSLILSHINMSHDVDKYLKSVKYLLESTKTMEVLPTLVNCPGFTQGLGLDIMAHSLRLVQPSLVIQINSKNPSKNYRIDLTADDITSYLKQENILSRDESNNNADLSYDFVHFDSMSESNEAWSLEARQGREIKLLSYFGQMFSESLRDFTSVDENMYSISISALSITNLEGKAISPLAINANLVALCSKSNTHPDIFSCYGYGFVRGMDIQADLLVLITPETTTTLENVSHLVVSSVTTPPSLIMSADGVEGHIPYVSVGDLVDFGQFTKRSYLPPRK